MVATTTTATTTTTANSVTCDIDTVESKFDNEIDLLFADVSWFQKSSGNAAKTLAAANRLGG